LSQERSTKGKKRSKRSLSSPQSFLDNSVTMQRSTRNIQDSSNVIFGTDSNVKTTSSVVIGTRVNAHLDHGDLDSVLASSVVIGADSHIHRGGTVAIGANVETLRNDAIAIGRFSKVNEDGGIALGFRADSESKYSIALGFMSRAEGMNSITIGSSLNGSSGKDDITFASGNQAIAIGTKVNSIGNYSTAVGFSAKALTYSATALGHNAYALGEYALALGYASKAQVEGGVALGSESVSDVESGIFGYVPLNSSLSYEDLIREAGWRSTLSAVSIGDPSDKKLRQIIGVSAGLADTDAVNVAQLKALEQTTHWQLTVDGKDATVVNARSGMNFSSGSSNFRISKGKQDNNVKFDLAKDITLDSVKVGGHILDAKGLIISNGPQIITTGIFAGNKKITGVTNGSDANDAVNFSQLQNVEKEIKEQLVASSIVKQAKEADPITIGKETGG
ncbi:hypothetical protein O9A_00444, partial [Bartonella koehlerae C-29]